MKAGLFSAVVTAFIIESYKNLKQDSSDISNILLLGILTQLEGRANGTDIVPQSITIPKFTPTSTDIRVNILWFLSLIFSLTTVLIGIIALQWLREHLRPRTDFEPQIAFSLHHLNVQSLDRWYLPQIFTFLPLLLQLALVLFLVGVLDFLRSLNFTVAIPIAVAIGSSLFFLLWTTVIPTIQALALFLPRWPWGNTPRSPCPYRSPQSWVFLQCVRPLVAILLSIFDKPDTRDRGFVSHSMILEKDRRIFNYGNSTSSRQRRPSDLIFRPNTGNSWAELEIAWLFQRDLDFMGQNPVFTKKASINRNLRPVPMYDAVQAVIRMGRRGSSWDNLLANHCVQPILQCNKSDESYMWYLSNLTGDKYLAHWQTKTKSLSVDALTHYAMLFFHRRIGSRQIGGVRASVVERVVNITVLMFADGAIWLDHIWALKWSPLTYWKPNELPGMLHVDVIISSRLIYHIGTLRWPRTITLYPSELLPQRRNLSPQRS